MEARTRSAGTRWGSSYGGATQPASCRSKARCLELNSRWARIPSARISHRRPEWNLDTPRPAGDGRKDSRGFHRSSPIKKGVGRLQPKESSEEPESNPATAG